MKKSSAFITLAAITLIGAIVFIAQGTPSVSPAADAPRPSPKSLKTDSVSTQGVPSGGVVASSPRKVNATVQRAWIWDKKNVLETAEWARKDGTPDQKGWAGELFLSCYFFSAPDSKPPDGDGSDKHKAQTDAYAELAQRCAGLKQMTYAQRREVLNDLRAGAEQSTSTYHTLRMLYKREDDRWSDDQVQVIGEALHSDDALNRKWAFFTLLQGIDQKAPGGSARHEALYFAMNQEIINPNLSEFERLSECAILPNCEMPTGGDAPQVDRRLLAAYLDAFAKHSTVRQILSIR